MMNDTKNLFIAYFSGLSTLLTAAETREVLAVISAIVLPVVFFTLGKAVDVALQIYLHRRRGETHRGRRGERERQ